MGQEAALADEWSILTAAIAGALASFCRGALCSILQTLHPNILKNLTDYTKGDSAAAYGFHV